jgi:hypothetical protein
MPYLQETAWMIRKTALVFAIAVLAATVVPVLFAANQAQAGCTRVYTTSGWITRCS